MLPHRDTQIFINFITIFLPEQNSSDPFEGCTAFHPSDEQKKPPDHDPYTMNTDAVLFPATDLATLWANFHGECILDCGSFFFIEIERTFNQL